MERSDTVVLCFLSAHCSVPYVVVVEKKKLFLFPFGEDDDKRIIHRVVVLY